MQLFTSCIQLEYMRITIKAAERFEPVRFGKTA